MFLRFLSLRGSRDVSARVPGSHIVSLAVVTALWAGVDAGVNPARASLASEVDVVHQPVRPALLSHVRVAQASNNPLKAFLSIFEKKKKRRPSPIILTPGKRLPRGVIIQRRGTGRGIGRGNGRRILNPFIGGGSGTAVSDQTPKPKTFSSGRRTMCVRLCDGYYWPMRRGGSNNSLMNDAQQCESQCTSPARLFVLRSSTDNIANMRDLAGRSYRKLENAFAYRQTYNPSCGCRAKPWSERARLRHKSYAAVGKERRVLAIRTIRLDLRSTLNVENDPKLVLASHVAPTDGPNDLALPVRRPAVRYVSEGLADASSKNENSVRWFSEPSSSFSPVAGHNGRSQSHWPGGGALERDGASLNLRAPQVFSFGRQRSSFQSRPRRMPILPSARSFLTPHIRQSAVAPVGLLLRSSMN